MPVGVFADGFENAGSGRDYAFIGAPGAHHEISHHQSLPENFAKLEIIDTWEVAQYAKLLQKLKDTPDGDGNLLDNTLVVYGSAMGNSNMHNHKRCPLFFAGHAGGRLVLRLNDGVHAQTPSS